MDEKRNSINSINLKKLYSNPTDPTASITSLATKLVLSMAIYASSIVFFQSENKKERMKSSWKKYLAILLVFSSFIISTVATYEFVKIMDKYIIIYKSGYSFLYDGEMLTVTKYVYIFVCITLMIVFGFTTRAIMMY